MASLEDTVTADMDIAAASLRSSRAGKMSHITRRMNIVNSLMSDENSLDQVKGNMIKLNESLEDFKVLHASYIETLDEETKNEDNKKWYKPRRAHITAFLANLAKWISAAENPGSRSLAEVPSSVTQLGEFPFEEGENTSQMVVSMRTIMRTIMRTRNQLGPMHQPLHHQHASMPRQKEPKIISQSFQAARKARN